MSAPVAPFVAVDGGDLSIYEDLEGMYAQIEAVDAGRMQFFDAPGSTLTVTVEGYRWHIDTSSAKAARPDEVEELLRRLLQPLARAPQ